MSTVYTCRNQRRRQRIADGIEIPASGGVLLNGIDFLEVLDTALLGSALEPERQRLLVIRCLQDRVGTIDAQNVVLEGGVRVTGIGVEWAMSLADARSGAGEVTAAEAAWLSTSFLGGDTADEARWIVVKVDARGDHSTYTLRLVEHGGEAPLAGFDRVLNEVDFAFKVECPTDLDCKPAESVVETPAAAPRIDYLARDWQSFRKLMLDRMSVVAPGWEERSPVDLGVTLVEILAYAADELSYYQDAVATEATLETARRRTSVRRHARLLDYPMHEGCNARAWVQLVLVEGQELLGDAEHPALPRGTPFLTWVGQSPVIPTASLDRALLRSPTVFESLHDRATLSWTQNEIAIHTFGEDDCCLPAGALGCSLVLPGGADLRLAAGDVLVLEELRHPETGARADADPAHRHAVRLRSVSTPYRDFVVEEQPWVVDVRWEAADAPPFGLCVRLVEDADGSRGPSLVARGNLVLADHGRSVDHDEDDPSAGPGDGEPLEPPRVPATNRYRPRLKGRDLTFAAPFDPDASAVASLQQSPREAVPLVLLRDAREGTVWEPVRDLLASDDSASEFVVETESDGRAWVRFGDAEHGRRPSASTELRAFYRVGKGTGGNLGADALCHVVSDDLGGAVRQVRNPMPAAGGQDPESIDEVKQYAPQAFRTQKRAVTAEDWATVCALHPEVQRAVARFRWTGSWYTVFLTVDRAGGQPIDADFEAELLDFLEPYRLAGYDLEITAPRMVPLHLALSVCVAPTAFRATVKSALLRALGTGLLADGTKALFHPDNWTFGQPVYLSRVLEAMMKVPGVSWVDATPNQSDPTAGFLHRFHRLHEPSTDGLSSGLITIGALEIARLDHDPSFPEYGRLELDLRGGL